MAHCWHLAGFFQPSPLLASEFSLLLFCFWFWVVEVLYIFWISISYPIYNLFLFPLDIVLLCTKVFSFDKVQFIFFLLFPVLFMSHSRNQCEIQGHESFLLFSPKSFIVLILMFRSLIPFELIFAYVVRWEFNFIILHVDTQFSQPVLPPLNSLGALVASGFTVFARD